MKVRVKSKRSELVYRRDDDGRKIAVDIMIHHIEGDPAAGCTRHPVAYVKERMRLCIINNVHRCPTTERTDIEQSVCSVQFFLRGFQQALFVLRTNPVRRIAVSDIVSKTEGAAAQFLFPADALGSGKDVCNTLNLLH